MQAAALQQTVLGLFPVGAVLVCGEYIRMSIDIDSKVVGYVAYTSKGMLCVGENHACLVAGSVDALRNRFEVKNERIAKARFDEIMFGIKHGGPYAFDQLAYRRFYALVQKAKIPLNLSHPDTMRLDLMYVGILHQIPA